MSRTAHTLTPDLIQYKLLNIYPACEILGVQVPTVYKMMDDGRLPFVWIGRTRKIKLSDILALIESCTIKNVPK